MGPDDIGMGVVGVANGDDVKGRDVGTAVFGAADGEGVSNISRTISAWQVLVRYQLTSHSLSDACHRH